MGKIFPVIALCLCAWAVLAGPQEDRAAAAERGNAEAQFNLGLMYANGQGVPQDYVEAHKWSNLSAASATDKETRDKATHIRDFVASKMTADQVSEAQKLVREWKPTPPVT